MPCSLSSIFTLRGKFRTPASRTAARQSTPPLCRTISRQTRRSWAARPTTLCKSINSFMFLWLQLAKLHLPPFKVILGGAKHSFQIRTANVPNISVQLSEQTFYTF